MIALLVRAWTWLKAHPGVYVATIAVFAFEAIRLIFLRPSPPPAPLIDLTRVAEAEGRAAVTREQAQALERQITPIEATIVREEKEEAKDLTTPPPSGLEAPGAVADWLTKGGL